MLLRLGTAVTVVVTLTCTLAGCGGKPVVGVLLPTSGSASIYGESIGSGVRLALADLREGRLPEETLPSNLQIEWADTGSNPQRAVNELRRMVRERHVKLVVGGATSSEAQALVPVLEELNVICLSPSASMPGLTKGTDRFFRLYPSDALEGSTAAKFLLDRIKRDSVILYTGDTDYTRGIEPEFRRQYEPRGKILERVDLTSPDWQAQSVAAQQRLTPGAVYVIGYAEEILEVLRHLASISFHGQVVTTSAFDNSVVIQRAGALAERVMFPLPPFDRTQERDPVGGFVDRYMKTYQRAPDVLAAHGYDAMRVAVKALSLARPLEASEIRKVLHFEAGLRNGVTGEIAFDDFGDVKHYPTMRVIANGQIISYEKYVDWLTKGIVTTLAGPTPAP